MKLHKNFFRILLEDESGQSLIEYGLIVGLIGLVAVAAMTSVGTKITAMFTSVAASLTAAT